MPRPIDAPKGSDAIEDLVRRSIALIDGREKPRLRFDKVALRFVETVKGAVGDAVPDGVTIAFTIAAPIRVASKTAVELEEKIREHLSHRSPPADVRETIQGNDIRVRIFNGPPGPKAVGFVHTAAPSAAKTLLDTTESVLKFVDGTKGIDQKP